MFDPSESGKVADALAALDSALARLGEIARTSASDDDLIELLKGLERHSRRLAALDHILLATADDRRLDFSRGYRSLTAFLHDLLRITTAEAAARAKAARNLGPRRELSGAPLDPLFAHVAEAEAAGELSATHARIIVRTVDRLPVAVQAEHAESVEQFLVEQGRQFPPETLASLAQRLSDTLNPDGTLSDENYRRLHRGLSVHIRRDGSSHVEGDLTAPATETLLTVLDATAAPKPEQDGLKDTRTATQRRHDGLLDALLALLRAGELPRTGGVTTTILLTMTAEVAAAGAGSVTTGHGATISLDQARPLIGGARVMPVIFDQARQVTAYGTAHRIFTEGQRLAMIARDQGCSFPGCDAGPLWCEAHHVTDFAFTGRTSIDDGTLLCGFHHREHARLGWECVMLAGVPHWLPPAWLDPQRQPRRNLAHGPHADTPTTTADQLVAPVTAAARPGDCALP